MYKRSVLVVEDEDFLRGLLAEFLDSAGFSVTTAANALDAKRIISHLDPDALVLDINLGRGPNGFDIALATQKTSPEIAIVFLTDLPDPRFAGIEDGKLPKNIAYLNKTMLEDVNTLLDALEATLTEKNIKNYRHDLDSERPLANLSRTQIQILQLMAAGKSNKQIAQLRKRSLAATESAISRTLDALGIGNSEEGNLRTEAVKRYLAVTKLPPEFANA